MPKSSGLIALLLVLAILLQPFEHAPETGFMQDSPQTARDESAASSDTAPQSGVKDDTAKLIAAVVIVILIIYLISCIGDTGSG